LTSAVAFASCVIYEDEPPPKKSTSATGGGGDGKFHPPTNSKKISEAAACEAVAKIIDKVAADLQCLPYTAQTCPSMLRSLYMPHCMQYDEGTVKGCVDFYNKFTKPDDCSRLLPDSCVLVGYPDTAPNGC
jgi:hypothetical protein